MENYEEIDIKRILEIIFSKKIFIILILLLSITLGYVYSYYYKQPEYKSSVTILLVADENKVDKELTQTDLNINSSLISTYSSIAKSTNVMQKTIDNLKLEMSASKLQKNVEATQIDKTQFLKITVKNSNPETAKNIANELAKVFTEQIKEIYNIENISVVDEAEIENKPCNINHIKDMVIFACSGIFVSIILVMAIYLFDDTIKDEKDIERNIKLKNIGTLPIDKEKNELIIENNPKSHIVECIKTIRTNILYSTNRKTILITSSRPKEGKSWIINNLAIAFAQANKKVILVDTDLRKANNTNEIFDVEKDEGLSDFIKEITDDELENLQKSREFIKETKIPNLHMLQNGTLPPNPAELISSENMKKLLDLLKNMYDVILLDGTPCMVVSDSIALSSMVDSTILVSESKKTKINDLKKTKKLIEDVNGKILGVISNKSEIQKGKYYGKRYGYYYGKEAEEIKKIEEIEEKLRPVSLEEIIEIAEENIKEKLLNKEETIVEKEELPEEKQEINYEIKGLRNEILNEIKKLKNIFIESKRDNTKKQINNITNNINNLKQIQENNNKQMIERIEKIKEIQNNNSEQLLEEVQGINYEKEFEKINNGLENNKEEYSKTLEEINDKIVNNKEEYSKTLEEINDKIVNNKEEYSRALEEMNNKLMNHKEEYAQIIKEIKTEDNERITLLIQQFVLEINNLKYEIKELKGAQENNNTELLERIERTDYKEKLAEINEKIENMNYDEKLAEINEKIANINYDEKLTEINNRIQEKEEKNESNIISFESLKERRKNGKRVFKTNESIKYEDLERLATCVIDLNEDISSNEVISN